MRTGRACGLVGILTLGAWAAAGFAWMALPEARARKPVVVDEGRQRNLGRFELAVRAVSGGAIERYAVALVPRDRGRPPAFLAEEARPDGRVTLAPPARDFWVEVRATGWKPERLGPFSTASVPEVLECVLASPERPLSCTGQTRPD